MGLLKVENCRSIFLGLLCVTGRQGKEIGEEIRVFILLEAMRSISLVFLMKILDRVNQFSD